MPAIAAIQGNSSADLCAPLLAFASLLVSTIHNKTEAERSREAARTELAEEFDIVIAGGGGAGCVLARRLSEEFQWRVLLLERGGSEPSEAHVPGFTDINLEATDITQDIVVAPDPHSCNGTGCELQIGRVLGGGTTINEMMFVRGNREDYNGWAKYTGDPSWSYDRVLPYFKKMETNLNPKYAADIEYHGIDGPLPVDELPFRPPFTADIAHALHSLDLVERDTNGAEQLGFMNTQAQARLGERWSTNRAYLQPVLDRPNLEVRTFAEVTRVLMDDTAQPPRARGVEYRDAAGTVRRAAARLEVVLAAGALHTPQLLMLSGLGPAQHLRDAGIEVIADLPVGENLQDHIFATGVEAFCNNCNSGNDWENRVRDLEWYERAGPPCTHRDGPLASRGPPFIEFIHTAGSDLLPTVPDIQMLYSGAFQEPTGVRCLSMDMWRVNVLVFAPALLHPQSVGYVRLNLSAPEAEPLVTPNYLQREEDLRTMVRGLQQALRRAEALEERGNYTLNRTPKTGCEGLEFASDAYLACLARTYTHTVWHYSGTAKMGRSDDRTAVVDSQLRVKGVEGLRVVDTSVMPWLTSGNVMAPVIMIAEKASDLIKQSHLHT